MQYTRPHVIPRSTSQYTRQAKNVPTAQTQVSRASGIKVHFGGICVPESEKERRWTETCVKNHVSGRHGATGSTFDPESRYILHFLFLQERSYRAPKNRSKKKQIIGGRAEEVQFMS